jgi:hypothetical protein
MVQPATFTPKAPIPGRSNYQQARKFAKFQRLQYPGAKVTRFKATDGTHKVRVENATPKPQRSRG